MTALGPCLAAVARKAARSQGRATTASWQLHTVQWLYEASLRRTTARTVATTCREIVRKGTSVRMSLLVMRMLQTVSEKTNLPTLCWWMEKICTMTACRMLHPSTRHVGDV